MSNAKVFPTELVWKLNNACPTPSSPVVMSPSSRTHFRKRWYVVFGFAVIATFTLVVPSLFRLTQIDPPITEGSLALTFALVQSEKSWRTRSVSGGGA